MLDAETLAMLKCFGLLIAWFALMVVSAFVMIVFLLTDDPKKREDRCREANLKRIKELSNGN